MGTTLSKWNFPTYLCMFHGPREAGMELREHHPQKEGVEVEHIKLSPKEKSFLESIYNTLGFFPSTPTTRTRSALDVFERMLYKFASRAYALSLSLNEVSITLTEEERKLIEDLVETANCEWRQIGIPLLYKFASAGHRLALQVKNNRKKANQPS